jgi:hypothetical protein
VVGVTNRVAALESSLVRSGTLRGLTADGAPLVAVPHGSDFPPVEARSCVPLSAQDVGCEVVLAFDADRPARPIVLGVIRPAVEGGGVQVTADGKDVTLTARESITLECGDARITLHRSGKIVIRGAHVVSHSSGVNRIRGGSVQLN